MFLRKMMTRLPRAGFFVTVQLLFGRLSRYRVEKESMVPTLMPGDEVAVDAKAKIFPGDIVVIRHPYKKDIVLIKRVVRIEPDGKLFLASDNPDGSTDSRAFGAVSLEYKKGKAVAVLST